MASDDIKLGSQVIAEFLSSLSENDAINARTVSTIHSLFQSGKLTRTQLVRALDALRSDAIEENSEAED